MKKKMEAVNRFIAMSDDGDIMMTESIEDMRMWIEEKMDTCSGLGVHDFYVYYADTKRGLLKCEVVPLGITVKIPKA